jgi:TPR repeat protein
MTPCLCKASRGDAMKSLLAVVFVVALVHGGEAKLLWKPARTLEKDWQEYVTLLRAETTTVAFFKRHSHDRINAWKQAAARGSTQGMVLLGNCMMLGLEVSKDEDEGLVQFRHAAHQGDTVAMVNLGIYLGQTGDEEQAKEGITWLRKAVKKGEHVALTYLGIAMLADVELKRIKRKGSSYFGKRQNWATLWQWGCAHPCSKKARELSKTLPKH